MLRRTAAGVVMRMAHVKPTLGVSSNTSEISPLH